jgi:tetratricopeptide (TPR) repeat protein
MSPIVRFPVLTAVICFCGAVMRSDQVPQSRAYPSTPSEAHLREANSLFDAGNKLLRSGDCRAAIAVYTQAIELSPDGGFFINRGLAKRCVGDNPGAMADYTKAIELDPSAAVAYYNRGGLKADSKDFEGALLDFSAAIERDNGYAEAFTNRGRIRHLLGGL